MPYKDDVVTTQISNDSADSKVILLETSSDCDTGYYEYLRLCKKCPYPSFGTDCQYICDCQNETCNHITGCQDKISTEGEITVGISAAKYLFSSVATLSEDAASTNNRDTISGLTKLVIVVGCIGVLIICLHFILCLLENTCRSSDQFIL